MHCSMELHGLYNNTKKDTFSATIVIVESMLSVRMYGLLRFTENIPMFQGHVRCMTMVKLVNAVSIGLVINN